jgi:septal ring factor EnvC (AmiA/AmiB activator)
VPAGRTVTAAFPGTVHFEGNVAGRTYVVLDLGGAVLLTYGGLAGTAAARGSRVAEGEFLGTSQGEVYVGVRRRGLPVDPAVLFGGTRARLVPPPSSTCPVGPATLPR